MRVAHFCDCEPGQVDGVEASVGRTVGLPRAAGTRSRIAGLRAARAYRPERFLTLLTAAYEDARRVSAPAGFRQRG